MFIPIATKTVHNDAIMSAIGWAKIIPSNPKMCGKIKIAGIKQIPCRNAPTMNPALPFPIESNSEEYTVKKPKSINESPLKTNAFCPIKIIFSSYVVNKEITCFEKIAQIVQIGRAHV